MSERLLQQLSLLPIRLAYHVLLTAIALGVGIAISVPLGIVCTRWRRLQSPLLAIAGVVQTVPSLALLALMVVLLGTIGFVPAIIALVLYSMLPILRNTVTGIAAVDPALVEAARGVGMSPTQMLLRVELPLAAPVIIAGIRTAAVWVIGIATLSTPVGQRSLGNYIFAGLQTQNHVAVLVGCIAAAALALAFDALIRLMELAAQRRSRALAGASLAGLCVLAIIGFTPLLHHDNGTLIVGSKTFTEQYILADLLTQRLQDQGFDAEKKEGMGSGILFQSLVNNSVDCYVDYSGTIWINAMKRRDIPDPDVVMSEMTRWLKETHGITCVGKLGFENTYALVMRREQADKLQVKSIADLARYAARMRIGGDYEFFARPEWKKLTHTYGLRFASTVSLDASLMYPAVQQDNIDVACAFSSDGRILAYDLVVLQDPQHAFPPYDAVMLLSERASRRPELLAALQPLIGAVSDETMRYANKQVDLDGRSPHAAASDVYRAVAKALDADAQASAK
jgi:osmoprotectant transport system permease protein